MATGQPVLIMIQGTEPGSWFKLPDNRPTTIGRSSQNTLRVVGSAFARFHCQIACRGGQWELTALGGGSGTLLNRTPVAGTSPLKAGDVIRLGSMLLRFDRIEENASQDSAMIAIKEAELDSRVVA